VSDEWVSVRPLTADCAVALARADHVCVGVSPFNGYFTPQRLAWLAAWALGEFEVVHFFVPDEPAAYTLQALGYPPRRAAHKARRQGAYVKNKIRRALTELGVIDPEPYLLDSATLHANAVFTNRLAEAHMLYRKDAAFAAACQDASRWVLDGRLPTAGLEARRLELAARYFLAELPLFADSVGITGRHTSVFCYHQAPPFLQRFYRRELTWQPQAGQGFAVVTASPAEPPAVHPSPAPPAAAQSIRRLGRGPASP
jgi:cyclo(L-tyrosyl-L-tyrosyl) synthase